MQSSAEYWQRQTQIVRIQETIPCEYNLMDQHWVL